MVLRHNPPLYDPELRVASDLKQKTISDLHRKTFLPGLDIIMKMYRNTAIALFKTKQIKRVKPTIRWGFSIVDI